MTAESKAQPEPAEQVVVTQQDLDRFFAQGNPLKLMDEILEMVKELKTQPLTETEKIQLARRLIRASNPIFIKELLAATTKPDRETVTALVDKASAHCYFADKEQSLNIRQYAIKNLLKYLKNLCKESIIKNLSQKQLLIIFFIYGQEFVSCALEVEIKNQEQIQILQYQIKAVVDKVDQLSEETKHRQQLSLDAFASQLLALLSEEQ